MHMKEYQSAYYIVSRYKVSEIVDVVTSLVILYSVNYWMNQLSVVISFLIGGLVTISSLVNEVVTPRLSSG